MKIINGIIFLLLSGCATGTAVLEMTETHTGPTFKVYAYHNYSDTRLTYQKITDRNNKEFSFNVNKSYLHGNPPFFNHDIINIEVDYNYLKQHKNGFSLIAHTKNNKTIAFYIPRKNINSLLGEEL